MKFESVEANKYFLLAVKVEKYMNKKNKEFIKGKISSEELKEIKTFIDTALIKNIELIEK